MTQADFNIIELNEKLYQVVVVENTELSHQDNIVHLLTLTTSSSKYFPLIH